MQEEDEPDDLILSDQDLPIWMETDVLYLFEWKGVKDSSDFIRSIKGAHMLMIEPIHKDKLPGQYHFSVEIKNETFIFETEYSTFVSDWLAALRRAKKSKEELSRSFKHKLYKNIDPLVCLFRAKVHQCNRRK